MTTAEAQTHDATLGDLFPFHSDQLKTQLSQELEKMDGWAKWSALVRTALLNEASHRFGELLNVSLVDILSGSLQKYVELLPYTDRSKYPPQDSVNKTLKKITIDSKHSPKIEVMLNEQPVLRIEIKVTLSLIIESLVLRIQNGKIMEIKTGKVHAEGAVKFGDTVLVEKKSAPIPFPGSINFGSGIEILPAHF